jgi:hypothetical protein
MPCERLLIGRVGVVVGELEASIVALSIVQRRIVVEGTARRVRNGWNKQEKQEDMPHVANERLSVAKARLG